MSPRPRNRRTTTSNRRKRRSSRLTDAQRSFLKQLFVGLGLFLLVGALLYGVWYVTRLPSFTISEVVVAGGETIDHEEVRERIETELSGTYFALVPNRFVYLYPDEAIAAAAEAVERVQTAKLTLPTRQQLHIAVSEYEPYALWCHAGSDEDCVFINETGYAFSDAPDLRGSSFVRFERIGGEVATGTDAFTETDLAYSRWFIAALAEALDWRVTRVVVDVEGDLYFVLTDESEVVASTREDKEATFENLRSVLESDEFDHLTPGNFQYIDLRFGNKVFVNEELAAPQGDTASSTATSTVESF